MGGASWDECKITALAMGTAPVLALQQRRKECGAMNLVRGPSSCLLCVQVGGCWVTGPSAGRPKATVHFLGGAFAGASPQLIYPLLLQTLAKAGYTVISTPYAVTFKHLDCARNVHDVRTLALKFSICTMYSTSLCGQVP